MGIRCWRHGHVFRQIFKRLRLPPSTQLSQYKLLTYISFPSLLSYLNSHQQKRDTRSQLQCIFHFLSLFLSLSSARGHIIIIWQSLKSFSSANMLEEKIISVKLKLYFSPTGKIFFYSSPSSSLCLFYTFITLNSLVTWIAHYTLAIFLSLSFFHLLFVTLYRTI